MHQIWINRLAWLTRLCVGMLFVGMSPLALADPPSRAGRIAEVAGTAWYFDADHNEWGRLIRNQTLAEGDRLRVDTNSRISMRIGSSSLWLDGGGDLEILQMDDTGVVLRLEKGALGLALRSQEAVNEYRVQTREGRLLPDDIGLYRVEQLPQGTRAQALRGRLRFESDRSGAMQRAWLREGEQAEFWWANGPRTEHQALLKDGFAGWLLSQTSATTGLVSEEYVSPEMTGVEDLDRNGRWEQATEYGTVWIPTQVAPGWEPYRDGRWVWTRNWGWSWVDDMPWGFAPFHYGRWVVWRGRWCWTPGHYVARPVYAPALVAWRQTPGLTIGVTIGQPPPRGTWSPLPPREVYVPTYRHSPDYGNRLNRPHEGPQRVEEPRRYIDPPQDNHRDGRDWNQGRNGETHRRESGSDVRPPNSQSYTPATISVLPQQQQQQQPAVRVEPAVNPNWRFQQGGRAQDAEVDRDRRRPASPAPLPPTPVVRSPEPVVQAPQNMARPAAPAGEDRSQPRKHEGKGRDKRESDGDR